MSTADVPVEFGYAVIEAASGEGAMRLIDRGGRFDLPVIDHLMLGIIGIDLARAVRGVGPGIPMLLVTGCAESAEVAADLPRLTCRSARTNSRQARLVGGRLGWGAGRRSSLLRVGWLGGGVKVRRGKALIASSFGGCPREAFAQRPPRTVRPLGYPRPDDLELMGPTPGGALRGSRRHPRGAGPVRPDREP